MNEQVGLRPEQDKGLEQLGRRCLLRGLLALTAVAAIMSPQPEAQAQAQYPSRTVTLTVPYPPGGATDTLARVVAQRLTGKWGQSVIVDNKPGGASLIGAEAVVRAPADGHHLLLTITTLIQAPHLQAGATLDPVKDLAPITEAARTPLVMVVHPSVKASTPAELVDLVKADPGKYSYGTYGAGSTGHLFGFVFNKQTGLDMPHVAYQGESPSVIDLVGGHIPIVIMSGIGAVPNIQAGKMRALAVTGPSRAAILPDVPSFKELGYTGMADAGWFGFFAPAGTPGPILEKVAADVNEILADPAVRERLAPLGLELVGSTPAEFSQTVARDAKKWGDLIKEAGLARN